MCVFHWVFLLFSSTRMLSLSCSSGRFWRFNFHVLEPPNAPKSTPKSLRKRFSILATFKTSNLPRFGAPLGTQNRPKIPSRPLGGHLAALESHLGGLSSCLGAHRGVLMTILGAPGPIWTPLGGDFCPIWAPPGPVLTPPKPYLAPRRGSFLLF